MKKVYVRPEMQMTDIKLNSHLLAASPESIELYEEETTYEQI